MCRSFRRFPEVSQPGVAPRLQVAKERAEAGFGEKGRRKSGKKKSRSRWRWRKVNKEGSKKVSRSRTNSSHGCDESAVSSADAWADRRIMPVLYF